MPQQRTAPESRQALAFEVDAKTGMPRRCLPGRTETDRCQRYVASAVRS